MSSTEDVGYDPTTPVEFGDMPHETISVELASQFMKTMRKHAPGLWGYYLAMAMTGEPPKGPALSRRRGAPDRQGGGA